MIEAEVVRGRTIGQVSEGLVEAEVESEAQLAELFALLVEEKL